MSADVAATGVAAAGAGGTADVVVIGSGPAGIACALQLVRCGRTVCVVDANRPRHAATLNSHGFISRDGLPPAELRRAIREEFLGYAPLASFVQARVTGIERVEPQAAGGAGDHINGPAQGRQPRFTVHASPLRGVGAVQLSARTVVVAVGCVEQLPPLPSIRVFYGTALHSCVMCDGYEKRGLPLALISSAVDTFEQAVRVRALTPQLTVFTGGSGALTAEQAAKLAAVGVTVRDEPIADLVGDRATLTGVQLASGEVVPVTAGFVRPDYRVPLEFVAGLGLPQVPAGAGSGIPGALVTDADGATQLTGLFACGEAGHVDGVTAGPGQLLQAAGSGARTAAAVQLRLAIDDLAL